MKQRKQKVKWQRKSNYISDNIKCEWVKPCIQKAEIIRIHPTTTTTNRIQNTWSRYRNEGMSIGDLNIPLSVMDRITRQKGIEDLNNAVNQLDLTDIYNTLRPRTRKYTFLSSARGNNLQTRP